MFRILVVNKFEFSNKVFVITKNVKFEFIKYFLFDFDLYCVIDYKYRFKYINLTLRKI